MQSQLLKTRQRATLLTTTSTFIPNELVAAGGLWPEGEARLNDVANWTFDADWTVSAGSATKAVGTTLQDIGRSLATTTGRTYFFAVRNINQAETGGLRVRLTGPNLQASFASGVTREHIIPFRNVSTDRTGVEVRGTSAYAGTVTTISGFDMTDILSQPCDIWLGMGQSNMATERWSLPEGGQTLADYPWQNTRILTYNQALFAGNDVGDVIGTPAPILPVNASAFGVSPLYFFANAFEPNVASGRNLMVIQLAKRATALVGLDAPWNPDGNVGDGATLYNNAVTQVQAALALNPSNELKGVLWGQGESDLTSDFGTTYPPAFTNLVSQFRTDTGVTDLKFLIIGPLPDGDDPNQALFISTQESLAQDSGSANAISNVYFVPRDDGWALEDGLHSRIHGSRIVGERAASVAASIEEADEGQLPPPLVPITNVASFGWNNSLDVFDGDGDVAGDESDVPYWMGLGATAAGYSFAHNYVFGFIEQWDRTNFPPAAGTDGWPGVADSTGGGDVASAALNAAFMNASNFRFTDPTVSGNNSGFSDVSTIQRFAEFADQLDGQWSGIKIDFGSGWSDFTSAAVAGSPNAANLSTWLTANRRRGSYALLQRQLIEGVIAARPALDINPVYVGEAIAHVLENSLSGLYTDDTLLEDGDSVHGRAPMYFLAGMARYHVAFRNKYPSTVTLPASVGTGIINNLSAVIDEMWAFQDLGTASTPQVTAPAITGGEGEFTITALPTISAPTITGGEGQFTRTA